MASSSGTKKERAPPPRRQSKAMSQTQKMFVDVQDEDSSAIDSELVPSSLAAIAPVLRVANQIEKDNPRVAYLCRFYAFKMAHRMDPPASGRGVRQFKTYLVHKLEKESEETKPQLARNDLQEIMVYYQNFYNKKIKEGQYTKEPEEMADILQIASVLYDALKAFVPPQRIDDQTHSYAQDVQSKREQHENYNILPLKAIGAKAAIMELPEVALLMQNSGPALLRPVFLLVQLNLDQNFSSPSYFYLFPAFTEQVRARRLFSRRKPSDAQVR